MSHLNNDMLSLIVLGMATLGVALMTMSTLNQRPMKEKGDERGPLTQDG